MEPQRWVDFLAIPKLVGRLAIGLWIVPLVAAADITVSSNFESGSAVIREIDQLGQRVRISPAGNPKRGMPSWWFARMDGLDPQKPTVLEVEALDVAVPNDAGKVVPLNPGWTLPLAAAVSTDGITWGRSAPGDRDGRTARYLLPPGATTVWAAWGPPFTPSDCEAFVRRVGIRHPSAKPFTLATSREGRAVMGLHFVPESGAKTKVPVVFMNGRQHAWECGGSWVCLGFVEWLLGGDPEAVWLRENAELAFVPLMDVDHVATGDGGKTAEPQDHNRDWSEKPHWPEVAAAQKWMLKAAGENRLAVYLDSHNPSPGARLQTFYTQYPPYCSEEAARANDRFFAEARKEFGEIRLLDGKPSVPEHLSIWKAISAPWVIEHGNVDTVSLVVETPWNVPEGTIEGYQTVGERLGRATARYLRGWRLGGGALPERYAEPNR